MLPNKLKKGSQNWPLSVRWGCLKVLSSLRTLHRGKSTNTQIKWIITFHDGIAHTPRNKVSCSHQGEGWVIKPSRKVCLWSLFEVLKKVTHWGYPEVQENPGNPFPKTLFFLPWLHLKYKSWNQFIGFWRKL
jgi:hypothetical protein